LIDGHSISPLLSLKKLQLSLSSDLHAMGDMLLQMLGGREATRPRFRKASHRCPWSAESAYWLHWSNTELIAWQCQVLLLGHNHYQQKQ
jgi:hypothetical protein